MSKKDDTDAAYYEDPENRRTRGPARKIPGHPRLSSHTPVRFDPGTIAAIRQFSDEDGITVSAWVRLVVNREIQRRVSLRTRTFPGRPATFNYERMTTITTTATATAHFSGELRPAV